ncbi:MAG: hypothetical protein ABIP93_10085 [Gemmatimonadaceae bacterium]
MRYAEIKDTLKTGDILLFRAGTTLPGKIVSWISRSLFSHVGMIVRREQTLCLWESGRDEVADVIVGKKVTGVHLVLLDDVLAAYTAFWEGEFILRRLSKDIDNEQATALREWMPSVDGKAFPALWQIPLDQLDALWNRSKMNRETFACAELIVDTYRRMNLLNMDRSPESFSAQDFSADAGMKLQFGYSLGDEILVTLDLGKGKGGAEAGGDKMFAAEIDRPALGPFVTDDSIIAP